MASSLAFTIVVHGPLALAPGVAIAVGIGVGVAELTERRQTPLQNGKRRL